jgi:hypothetical protein
MLKFTMNEWQWSLQKIQEKVGDQFAAQIRILIGFLYHRERGESQALAEEDNRFGSSLTFGDTAKSRFVPVFQRGSNWTFPFT